MTKMSQNKLKSLRYLWPKWLKNHALWGRSYLYGPYKGVPRPLPPLSWLRTMQTDLWNLNVILASLNSRQPVRKSKSCVLAKTWLRLFNKNGIWLVFFFLPKFGNSFQYKAITSIWGLEDIISTNCIYQIFPRNCNLAESFFSLMCNLQEESGR